MTTPTTTRRVPASALRAPLGQLRFALAASDSVTPGSAQTPAKTAVNLLIRTPEPIQHWFFGLLIHDMAGFQPRKERITLDWLHEDTEIVGYVENLQASDDAGLTGTGTLVSIAPDDRAAEIAAKGAAGVPYEASLDWSAPAVLEEVPEGFQATVNARTITGPATIVRQWSARSVAVCPWGADPNTLTQFAGDAPEVEVTILTAAQPAPAKDPAMPDVIVDTPEQIAERVEAELVARITDYTTRFGAQAGHAWAMAKRPLPDCYAEHLSAVQAQHATELAANQAQHAAAVAELQTKLTAAEAQAADLQARLSAVTVGEKSPVSSTPAAAESQLTQAEQTQLSPSLRKFVAAQRAAKAAVVALLCILGLCFAVPAAAQSQMPRFDRLKATTAPALTDKVAVVRSTTPYQMTLSQLLGAAAAAGTVVTDKSTAVEYGIGPIHQTILTLTLTGTNDLDLADGAHGTGVKVYDFPAGRILVLGATCNLSVAHNGAFNASTADTFSFAVGTAVGADDDALTSTEADLIPSQTLDTESGATTPLTAAAALAASAHFDGTTTAKDVYVNVACAAANNSGATTYAVTGTITLTWINLGDY